MSKSDAIFELIARIRADKELPPRDIRSEDARGEEGLGLDSLDMATLVAELEEAFDEDPFANDTPEFQTVAEFVRLYETGSGT